MITNHENIWNNSNIFREFIKKKNHIHKLSIYLIYHRCLILYMKSDSKYWSLFESNYINIIKKTSKNFIFQCINKSDFLKICKIAEMIDWWYSLNNNDQTLFDFLINNIDNMLMSIILNIVEFVIHIIEKNHKDIYISFINQNM